MTDEILPWLLRSREHAAEGAARGFIESADFEDGFDGGRYAPEGYLESYLFHWLAAERGIAFTGGDYTTFIKAAFLIAEQVMLQPDVLDVGLPQEKPRRIIGLIDPSLTRPTCFEPRFYETLKFWFLEKGVRPPDE